VLEAQGSVMTTNMPKGYPGRRLFMADVIFVDIAEELAIDAGQAAV